MIATVLGPAAILPFGNLGGDLLAEQYREGRRY
jgi:hypothetical protein